MRLLTKIEKLFNLDAWHSALAALRRLTYPLPAKPFIDAVDRERFQKVRARYQLPGEKINPKKYLELEPWMRMNVKRIRDSRIRQAPPKLRILDIGSGSGYFLHIAKCLGHDVLGLDLDFEPVFRETFEVLGLPRVIHWIKPFEPLPDLGAKFDLITAHMTCFNRRADNTHWGSAEWKYFMENLGHHLKPGGRVEFDLNPLPDGQHMAPELREYFRSLGARVDRRSVHLNAPQLQSISSG